MDWRKCLTLVIAVFQAFLVSKLLRWCWTLVRARVRGSQRGHACTFCTCSSLWRWCQNYTRKDDRVLKAVAVNQSGIFIIGCWVLVVVFTLRLTSFQARAFGLLPSSPRWASTPFPSQEVFLAMVWISAALIGSFKQVVTPRNLDAFCILFYCLGLLSLLLTSVRDVDEFYGIIYRVVGIRFLPDLASTRAEIPFVANLLCIAVVLMRHLQPPLADLGGVELDQASIMLMTPFLGSMMLRQVIYGTTLVSLDLKMLIVERNAVSSLLLGLCDAVVEVDENLKLTEDGRQLSTMLLHGRGVSAQQLAGSDLLGFFVPDDREHVQQNICGSPDDAQTRVFNARMLDGLSNQVAVELFHISLQSNDNRKRYLVGMREFQELGFLAPLRESRERPHHGRKANDFSLVFCASSARILTTGKEIERLLLSNGLDREELHEMAVWDLLYGLDPGWQRYLKDKGCDITQPQLYDLGLVYLLGSVPVQASLVLRQDHDLGHLVGVLRVVPSRPSRPSRSLDSESPSSPSTRSLSQSGSIADLHRVISL